MSLADRLARPAPPPERCPVADVLATLPPSDADALLLALVPKRMDSCDIRAALRAEGHTITEHAIRVHKRGRCACRSQIAS